MQTVGGAVIGTFIGQQFNGTLIPNATAYVVMGTLVLCCVLIAEKGKLFGVGVEYQAAPAIAE
jgi:DHA1 family bicyclomycin/chloramphenicol resistance-like MFS transporter